MLKIGIVDDEENAKRVIKKYIERSIDNYEIVFEASEYQNAIDLSLLHEPDILLLDIHLSNGSGIEIAKILKDKINSKIIFTTADRQHVLKAIKVSAFDYLLKPIDSDEMKESLERAILEIEEDNLKKTINSEEISFQTSDGIKKLVSNSISFIKAEGSYCEVNLKNGEVVTISKPLKFIEDQIENNADFLKTHRGYIVNTDNVETLDRNTNELILEDGVKVPISRRCLKMVFDFFQPK